MKHFYYIILFGTLYSIALSAQPQGLITGAFLYGLDQTGFIENDFKLDSIHVIDSSDKSTSRMTFKYSSSGNLSEIYLYDEGIIEECLFYYSDKGVLLKQEINYISDTYEYTIFSEPSEYDKMTGRPSVSTFYMKNIKSNGTVELIPVLKYEVEGYSNNHPEGVSMYQFYDNEWLPYSQGLFAYDNRGLLLQEYLANVEINEGTIRFIATVSLKDYEYDKKGNIVKESVQEGVIIYYSDGSHKEMAGESYVCTYENGYDENGLLMYQIEYGNDGNEEGTLYYYWSKVEGSSMESTIIDSSSEGMPYYELDGRQISEKALQSGRIYIHNGKKVLIR